MNLQACTVTKYCCLWQELPEAPPELVAELSRRYIYLYQQITGEDFVPASVTEDPQQRMQKAVESALKQLNL